MTVRVIPNLAERHLRQLARKNSGAFESVRDTLRIVQDVGWGAAQRGAQIKLIEGRTGVGEIRDMAAAYRIVFFWEDCPGGVRLLHLTDVERKSRLKPRRLAQLARHAEKLRRDWLATRKGEFCP